MKMKEYNKFIILIGILMLLGSLLWMMEPYYTWAQEQNGHPCRVALEPEVPLFELENMNPGDTNEESITVIKTGSSPAELYFAWEYIEGDPELGEEGSLFDQLEMVIISEGEEVFTGNMSDWQYDRENPSIDDTINLTDVLEMEAILEGEEITLDITIHLPGPETGNEFQGSTVTARLVFFTICYGDDPEPDPDREPDPDPDTDPNPEELVVDPDEPEVSPDPVPEADQPGEDETLIIEPETPKTSPPLPRTDGASLGLLAAGALFLIIGTIMAKTNYRQI